MWLNLIGKDVKKVVTCALLTASILGKSSFISLADVGVDIGKGRVETVDGETYIIRGRTDRDSLNNIIVNGGTVRIILDNADISLSDWVEAVSINNGANVTLELRGENKIETGWGIIVTFGSNLNITGDGSLSVIARNSSAIGNVMYDSRGMGNINIQSGKLDLKSEYGCGIGCTVSKDGINKIGEINISGGEVKAYGSADCAGIGSGDASTLGNIYIGGDSIVEASSIQGAGIGTGGNDKTSVENIGEISIGGEANVRAVSYSGAGIGTGGKGDKVTKVSVTDKAKVYAESFQANSIGDGVESSHGTVVGIDKDADVMCVSYKSDAISENNNSNMLEVKMDTAPLEDMQLDIEIEDGKIESVSVPKDSLSVARSVKSNVGYKRVSAKNKNSIVYLSCWGNDENAGLSENEPVRSFSKAYEIVDNAGKIVVISKNEKLGIDRVANLDKRVMVIGLDESSVITLDMSSRKIYDNISFDNIIVNKVGNYTSREVERLVEFKNVSVRDNRKSNIERIEASRGFKFIGGDFIKNSLNL